MTGKTKKLNVLIYSLSLVGVFSIFLKWSGQKTPIILMALVTISIFTLSQKNKKR